MFCALESLLLLLKHMTFLQILAQRRRNNLMIEYDVH